MRKVVLTVFVMIFAIFSILLVTGIFKKAQKHKQISEMISKLPTFSYTTLTNETFNSTEIKRGPVLIVRFHRECEHCQYEISELLKSSIPGCGANVILVSSDYPDSIRRFLNKFKYTDYPSVIPLADTSYTFGDIFGGDVIPSNYIYNKNLDLVKVLTGEVKTETILKYLLSSE